VFLFAAGLAASFACAEGFDVGIATYSFRNVTAFEAIERTKACGGDVIEFFLWQKLSPEHPEVILNQDIAEEHLTALKAKLQASGVRAVSAYFNNAVFRDKAKAEANTRKLFAFAQKLGLRGLTGEPPVEQLDLVETDRTDKLHFRVSGGIRQSRITVLLSSWARAGRAGRRFRRAFFDARR